MLAPQLDGLARRACRRRPACDVDEDVYAPEFPSHFMEMRVNLLQIADIPAESQRPRPGPANIVDRSIDGTLIDISHSDHRPFTRERGRDRAPQTASSTEHERRLAFEP